MTYHGTLARTYDSRLPLKPLAWRTRRCRERSSGFLGTGLKRVPWKAWRDNTAWLRRSGGLDLSCRWKFPLLDFSFPNKLPEYIIIIGKAVIVSRLKAIWHYFSEEALA